MNARTLVKTTLRRQRQIARLEAEGIRMESDAHDFTVSGNTYPVRAALKACGFRWVPGRKVWVYKLRTYSNLRFSCGRLMDGTVTRHPYPTGYVEGMIAALFTPAG